MVWQYIAHSRCRSLTTEDLDDMGVMYHIQFKDKLLSQDWLELYATEILDPQYQWTAATDAVDKQLHMNAHQNIFSFYK